MTKTMAYYNRHIISEKELEGEFEKEIASSSGEFSKKRLFICNKNLFDQSTKDYIINITFKVIDHNVLYSFPTLQKAIEFYNKCL
jgi:hypothetical protein